MTTNQILLTDLLVIDFPIILAPMYMVSSEAMTIEAMNAGIAACMPAQNWDSIDEMKEGIRNIRKNTTHGALGINLWTLQYNKFLQDQIEVCKTEKVDFIYTSLGNPKFIIKSFQNTSIKVFCAVANETQANKIEDLGVDALIVPFQIINAVSETTKKPLIASGEIATGNAIYNSIHQDKTAGCVLGSLFIAAEESAASLKYKKACVSYQSKNIVKTEKEMPFPITVLNTPYIRRQGLSRPFLIKLFAKFNFLQSFFKKLLFQKGLKLLKNAANDKSYKKFWLASRSIHHSKEIHKTKYIINSLINTYNKLAKQKALMSRSISRES